MCDRSQVHVQQPPQQRRRGSGWRRIRRRIRRQGLTVRKAVRDGSSFDTWTSGAIIVGYAIPGFLFAILLIVLFAGGSYWEWFPLRGLTSDNFDQLPWWRQALDYLHHITLPTLAIVIGNFATLTMLTKNSFLDEISKQYVQTARAKGLTRNATLWRHAVRNAFIPVLTILGLQFSFLIAGTIIIENVFYLPGLGRLIFQAITQRDLIVVKSVVVLLVGTVIVVTFLVDMAYAAADPRLRKR